MARAEDIELATRPAEGPTATAQVRRRVFYLHGFDPRGPAHYHALYAEQAPRQAALTGAKVTVGPRRNKGKLLSQWRIEAEYDGAQVVTDYGFLRWDDLVRARWTRDELALLRDVWRCLFVFQTSGSLRLLRRGALPSYAAALFPAAVSSLFLIAAFAIVAGLSFAGYEIADRFGAPGWLGALPPLLLLTQLRRAWRWTDERLNVSWLNRSITYMVDHAAGRIPSDPRWKHFAEQVAQAAADPEIDEVLIVGHSQGTAHAVRIAALALRENPTLGRGHAKVSLLTVGQPFAIYTSLPDDTAFRRDLAELAAADAIAWTDFTMPSDPASSGGIDPLHGVAVSPGAPWPIRRTPRFHTLMSKQGFRAIRANALKFHFQYLMAGEKPGEYDYFRLTAGPDPLGAKALPKAPGACDTPTP